MTNEHRDGPTRASGAKAATASLSRSISRFRDVITALVVVFVTISIISFLLAGKPDQEQAYAQNQTQVTNFTQLFSTEKEFQDCGAAGCIQPIRVLYQDPALLVLGSDYVDLIWKGVARAQKDGYQIDTMTSYAVSNVDPNSGYNVSLLVVMSR